MFVVDLDELLETVDEMTRCTTALDDLLKEVRQRVAELHGTWDGHAATAQAAAQTEWGRGFRSMQEALVAIRGAARLAHGNYTDAVSANVRMWEAV